MNRTNKLMRTALTVFFAIGVLAVSLAQGSAGTGGGRGGFGGGQRGGFGRNQNDLISLAARTDVQTDAGVTAEQKGKIEALQAAIQEARRAQMEEMRNSGGGGAPDFEAMRAQMEKQQVENEKKLAEILKPEQMLRLKEIRVQLQGNRAILDASVQKSLKMTPEQLGKIKTLQDNLNAANQSLFEEMRNGGDRDSLRERMTKNNDTFNAELGKILTSTQTDELKKMGGKPFKATPPPSGGGL